MDIFEDLGGCWLIGLAVVLVALLAVCVIAVLVGGSLTDWPGG
jgi:hypothetical protein